MTDTRCFTPQGLDAFRDAYPGEAAPVLHRLHDHSLFALEALAELAERLPADHVEHSFGNLAVDQDPDDVGRADMPVGEIVRTIRTNRCWMVLKKVDTDPAYAALIDACLAEIAPVVAPATGPYRRREAFVFLSSPNSVTPFHMDPEHNILLQIAGQKTMRVYPAGDLAIVPQDVHEAFHRGGRHRNMRHDPAFDAAATDFPMEAGQAVYVPVKAPHWVQNGPEVSISFSITWRSDASDAEARLHRVNQRIRTLGIAPAAPGAAPAIDAAKVATHKLVKRAARGVKRAIGRGGERSAY
ncbi:cupin-like domain-containing protein [Sphingomonas baiyangensis]|uniref:Transcriptional regulator n=1 Tax=Sphingomonas baiyangensis TaxID=2572576 RepID=A0A4U1L4A8_9SPHN|nr:cupin-like domain-containing protein [Sphingomonas baiyangensis]TKD51033.1 transcriptional regulator [Sphingomonas baiyangensis]